MKMRVLNLTIAMLIFFTANAQRNIAPVDTLYVYGRIKNPVIFTLADIDKFPKTDIKDQIIYNKKGEIKDTLTGMKGTPLKALLASTEYVYDKPRHLNEIYFVFISSDAYKVVFTWNEIYNTETGNNFYIITEMNGKKLKDLKQRIMFISTGDLTTGRRFIKGLEKIEIRQVE